MNSTVIFVGLGGFLGAVLRYFVALACNNSLLATMLVNIIGCFLIGVISSLAAWYHPLSQHYRLLIITGFLGSFTTFSAFGLDSFDLLKNGYQYEAILYIVIQVAMGISMVFLGDVLVKKFMLSV